MHRNNAALRETRASRTIKPARHDGSSAPRVATTVARGADAALREAFFDADEAHENEREKLREFERIWKHIISRELLSTEL